MEEDWYIVWRGWLVVLVAHVVWLVACTEHTRRDIWNAGFFIAACLANRKLYSILGASTSVFESRKKFKEPVTFQASGHKSTRQANSFCAVPDAHDIRSADQSEAMSGTAITEGDLRRRGRVVSHSRHTKAVTTSSKVNSHSPRTRETSTAAIFFADDGKDLTSDGSIATSNYSSPDVNGPTNIISPPPAFRSNAMDDSSINSEGSVPDPMYAQVRRPPKPQVEVNTGFQSHSMSSTSSYSIDDQIQTAADRRHWEQRVIASSRSLDAPVPAPRRARRHVQTSEMAGHTQHHDTLSSSSSLDVVIPISRKSKENGIQSRERRSHGQVQGRGRHGSGEDLSPAEADFDEYSNDSDILMDSSMSSASDTIVNAPAVAPTSSPTQKTAETSQKSTSYPVQWIGSVPISEQLQGKQRSDSIIALTSRLSLHDESVGKNGGQLLRVSSNSVETLTEHTGDVIRSYGFSEIVEHHAVTLQGDNRPSYLAFVTHDRHYGHICHVFECAGQSARPLAASLYDVIVTSRPGPEKRSPVPVKKKKEKKKKETSATKEKSAKTNAKIVNDPNNNSVIIGKPTKPVQATDGETKIRNGILCQFMGLVEVPKPYGINMLHRATRALSEEIPRDSWREVTARVTPTAIELFRDSRKLTMYDLHNITFLGIDSVDKAIGAFVAEKENGAGKQWFAHGFFCQPSAAVFCAAIKTACEASYESRRRHPEKVNYTHVDPGLGMRRTQSTSTAEQQMMYERRHHYDDHHVATVQPQQLRRSHGSTSPSHLLPHYTGVYGSLTRVRPEQRPVKYYAVTAPRQRRAQSSSGRQESRKSETKK